MAEGDASLDFARLVHELQVHQLELEAQNESLIRAQEELEASRRRYIELFALAPFGYLALDMKGAVIEANAAAHRLLGVGPAHLLGRSLGSFVEPASRERWRSFLAGLAASEPEPVDLPVVAGGRAFTASFSGVAVKDGDGDVRCYCAVHDVSRERLAEAVLLAEKERAEDASRAKSEFLARVSHELRTPLSSIQMATELALAEALPPRPRHYLELALRAAEGLLAVISETLDLAKIEARRVELADEPFELAAALEASLGPLRASAEAKGLALGIDVATTLPQWFRGDRGRLGQVLINLVGNAIKFTTTGGVGVVVRAADEAATRADALRLLFVVHDTGCGFPQETSAALFEPFNRAGSGGVGLGLTIARELVALMGGRIWARARPGLGATFSFVVELAVIHEAPRPAEVRPEEPAQVRPRTILLAEDDPICSETEEALLASAGHRVVVVSDGREALETLARGGVEVVLLDVHMPEFGGDDVVQRIRGGGAPGVPQDLIIIGLTAVLLAGDAERHRALGMDECLAKPLDLGRLQRALARIDRERAASGGSASA